MSPVDWAGPVTSLQFPLLKYEKVGQPSYWDLGFYNQGLSNQDETFPIWTLKDETFLTK
jgi:hypothetical protein